MFARTVAIEYNLKVAVAFARTVAGGIVAGCHPLKVTVPVPAVAAAEITIVVELVMDDMYAPLGTLVPLTDSPIPSSPVEGSVIEVEAVVVIFAKEALTVTDAVPAVAAEDITNVVELVMDDMVAPLGI